MQPQITEEEEENEEKIEEFMLDEKNIAEVLKSQ
jgi:hypothetical protein